MNTMLLEPCIRVQMKDAIASVFLRQGHGQEVASDAGEMFVRLIEMSMTRLQDDDTDDEDRA